MTLEEYKAKADALGVDRGKLADQVSGSQLNDELPEETAKPEVLKPEVCVTSTFPANVSPEPARALAAQIKAGEAAKKPKVSKPKPAAISKPQKPATVSKPVSNLPPPIASLPNLSSYVTDDQMLQVAHALCTTQGQFTESQLMLALAELTMTGELGLVLFNGIISGDILIEVIDGGLWYSAKDRPLDRSLLTPGTVLRYTKAGCVQLGKPLGELVTFLKWAEDHTSVWLKVRDKKGHSNNCKYIADYLDFLAYCKESVTGIAQQEDWSI